jgi:alpha-N-arabinofuranosidase
MTNIQPASARVYIDLERRLGERNPLLFGHFLEHFHRTIYGGIYDPASRFADAHGFRSDVIQALRRIRPAILRWPGGCFVSAYHWEDGVGAHRPSRWDKAWRVVEPNHFGTDEFVRFCRLVDAEPFICGNAGTGTMEEMANWVEYCNLESRTALSDKRHNNGVEEPHRVRYWSIGNENYGAWELGAKDAHEWQRYVSETAKLMKRVDPDIALTVAAIADFEWDHEFLEVAHPYIDMISIHTYGVGYRFDDPPGFEHDYLAVVAGAQEAEKRLLLAEHLIGTLGLTDKIKVAYDEWNPRGWYHPSFLQPDAKVAERDRNDDNRTYTMADAVSAACFLNLCHRHCQSVHISNFAPAVNTRGLIFTHAEGLVLRPTYHVYDLFANHTFPLVLDAHCVCDVLDAQTRDGVVQLPEIDVSVTCDTAMKRMAAVLVNRRPERAVHCEVLIPGKSVNPQYLILSLQGDSPDTYNDIDQPAHVRIETQQRTALDARLIIDLPAHSVNLVLLELE